MQQPSYAHGMPKAVEITVIDPDVGPADPVATADEGRYVGTGGGVDVYLDHPQIQDGYEFSKATLYQVRAKNARGETVQWPRLYWVSPPGSDAMLDILTFSSNGPQP